MTDIEKKASEYAANAPYDVDMCGSAAEEAEETVKDAFLAGATYVLGNQWRDAEKEKPEYGGQVLIMSDDSEYPAFGEWCGNHWEREDADVISRSNDDYYPFKVIAWLPIPQYKPKGE